MYHRTRFAISLPLFLLVLSSSVASQGLPASQPALLVVYREQVKPGHSGAHAKSEAMWPAAYAKAKSQNYYLAMSSMTGMPVVWFVLPWASYDAMGKAMAKDEADPVLSAELARAHEADGPHIDNLPSLELMARPDLSHGAYPDMNRQRFWEISIWRIKPGHEEQFVAAAKTYKALATRLMPNAAWRAYQVTAGMPAPTFVIFSSVESLGAFDRNMSEDMAAMQQMTPEERATFTKFNSEDVMSVETNRFRLDPKMSYVSPDTRATDIAFWGAK